jgi:hypothetical protein
MFTCEYSSEDYVFYGEIVGEVPSSAKGPQGESTTGLKVRVLESLTSTVAPRAELEVFAFNMFGSTCRISGVSLTTTDCPIGSRVFVNVSVNVKELKFGYWDRHFRFAQIGGRI